MYPRDMISNIVYVGELLCICVYVYMCVCVHVHLNVNEFRLNVDRHAYYEYEYLLACLPTHMSDDFCHDKRTFAAKSPKQHNH